MGIERHGDLDAQRVLAGAEKLVDLEVLPDPAEEQHEGPAALVEVGDLLGRGVVVIGQEAQDGAGLGGDADFAHRVAEGILALPRLAPGPPQGPFRGSIVIDTGDPAEPRLTVPVVGTVA